jgi:hypothetical protein
MSKSYVEPVTSGLASFDSPGVGFTRVAEVLVTVRWHGIWHAFVGEKILDPALAD